jgi:hypothetical protein
MCLAVGKQKSANPKYIVLCCGCSEVRNNQEGNSLMATDVLESRVTSVRVADEQDRSIAAHLKYVCGAKDLLPLQTRIEETLEQCPEGLRSGICISMLRELVNWHAQRTNSGLDIRSLVGLLLEV